MAQPLHGGLAQSARQLGEEPVRHPDGTSAARRQLLDGGCSEGEVVVEVVEEPVTVGVVDAVRVDAREVAATELVAVGGDVSQEVHLLEGGPEA